MPKHADTSNAPKLEPGSTSSGRKLFFDGAPPAELNLEHFRICLAKFLDEAAIAGVDVEIIVEAQELARQAAAEISRLRLADPRKRATLALAERLARIDEVLKHLPAGERNRVVEARIGVPQRTQQRLRKLLASVKTS